MCVYIYKLVSVKIHAYYYRLLACLEIIGDIPKDLPFRSH